MTLTTHPMNIPRSLFRAVALASLAGLLGGCADSPLLGKTPARTPSHPKAAAVVERDASAPREAAPRPKPAARDDAPAPNAGLQEGVRLYNEGDYNGAIRRLSARDVNNGPLSTRLTALKYMAFSYCVTARPAPCRQAFDRALRLDPSFDLSPGEHGHPLWGPVFTAAKQAAVTR